MTKESLPIRIEYMTPAKSMPGPYFISGIVGGISTSTFVPSPERVLVYFCKNYVYGEDLLQPFHPEISKEAERRMGSDFADILRGFGDISALVRKAELDVQRAVVKVLGIY